MCSMRQPIGACCGYDATGDTLHVSFTIFCSSNGRLQALRRCEKDHPIALDKAIVARGAQAAPRFERPPKGGVYASRLIMFGVHPQCG